MLTFFPGFLPCLGEAFSVLFAYYLVSNNSTLYCESQEKCIKWPWCGVVGSYNFLGYHIHITTDKSYFYMTSNEHESNSILIFRADGNDSDYVKYRNLVGSKNQKYFFN